MMELIATSQNVKLFEQFFEMTMKTLQEDRKDLSSDRLWFKSHIKVCVCVCVCCAEPWGLCFDSCVYCFPPCQLGKMYLDSEDYVKLAKILKQLESSCLVRFMISWCLDVPLLPMIVYLAPNSILTGQMMKRKEHNYLRYFHWNFQCSQHRYTCAYR